MISKRIQEVEPSRTVELTNRIAAMRREGIPVIGLNVGEPDFDTPLRKDLQGTRRSWVCRR